MLAFVDSGPRVLGRELGAVRIVKVGVNELAAAPAPEIVVAAVAAVEVGLYVIRPRRPAKIRRAMPATIGEGCLVLVLHDAVPVMRAGRMFGPMTPVARI